MAAKTQTITIDGHPYLAKKSGNTITFIPVKPKKGMVGGFPTFTLPKFSLKFGFSDTADALFHVPLKAPKEFFYAEVCGIKVADIDLNLAPK